MRLDEIYLKKDIIFLIPLLISFIIIAPVIGLFVLLPLFIYFDFSSNSRRLIYLYIAVVFGLLAFTQKSMADIETDIARYYNQFSIFLDVNIQDALILQTLSSGDLYFGFSIISALLVSFFENVQVISLFWIFLTYALYFLTIDNYCLYRNIKLNSNHYLILIIASIFGFILFTQVTETIKQAVSYSLFFYGFSWILREKKLWGAVLIVISLTIHSTPVFLCLLLLYKKMNRKILITLSLGSLFFVIFNVNQLIDTITPNLLIFSEVKDKASNYSGELEGFSSSIRYIALSFVLLMSVIFVSKVKTNITEFVRYSWLYLLIRVFNFSSGHNFVRMVNMSHFVYAFTFIEIISIPQNVNRYRKVVIFSFLFIFFVTNFQMTYGRTVSGQYRSSYMDNSVTKILFSNIFDYLDFKAY